MATNYTSKGFAMGAAASVLAVAVAVLSASCTDPVRDRAIEKLGGEGIGGTGPDHRPGQPCVLCHAADGPAGKKPFAVGGTVFQTPAAQSKGAPNVRVLFVDSANAKRETVTNGVGNFFIREDEWPDLTYPFIVNIVANGKKIAMTTTVNREGSCNACHKPNSGSPLGVPGEDPRESIGQIYVSNTP